jgi:hypothetical protein
MTKPATRICQEILEGGIPAPGRPSAYAEIADSPVFLKAVEAILAEEVSDDKKAMKRAIDLADVLSMARACHGDSDGRMPIWVMKPDLDDWKQRQLNAAEQLRQAASEVDGPGVIRYQEMIFERPRPGDGAALCDYLSRNTCDISNPDDVLRLAEHALLGQMLRSLAESIETAEPDQMLTKLERVFADIAPSLRPGMAGKRGGAKTSQASANRGAIVRVLDTHIPGGVKERNALIAKLAQIVDAGITRQNVRATLADGARR